MKLGGRRRGRIKAAVRGMSLRTRLLLVIGVLAASTRVLGLYARLGYRDHAIRIRKKLGPTA